MNQETCVSNNLKQIRKLRGLRQIDVAQMLGHVSTDRISHWEKGLANPGIENLFKLSNIYGITPQDLYAGLYATIEQSFKGQGGPPGKIKTPDKDLSARELSASIRSEAGN